MTHMYRAIVFASSGLVLAAIALVLGGSVDPFFGAAGFILAIALEVLAFRSLKKHDGGPC